MESKDKTKPIIVVAYASIMIAYAIIFYHKIGKEQN